MGICNQSVQIDCGRTPNIIGTRLGPYEILSAVGAGGMGEVYKARDTRLDRLVAVKVLAQALAESVDARERFERFLAVIHEVVANEQPLTAIQR